MAKITASVWAVSRRSGVPRRLMRDPERQLQVTLADNRLALLATEYSGADPQVVDLKTGSVIFRARGEMASWVP